MSKKNEKYEKKQKSKKNIKIYNMKYEKKAFCDFVNMKYEKFNGQKRNYFGVYSRQYEI